MQHPSLTERTYYLVFAALLALTVLTVGLSFLELGTWHAVSGLGIATAKAALVILFFMHVVHSSRLTWLVILGALLWLGILMTLTLADYLSRGWGAY